MRAIRQPAVTTVAPAMAAKTHAHAVTTAAAAAGRCLHASTSSPPPPPPPPISRLVGKYPHTPRSNQSALACPRGCSHGPGGILSLPLFRFARSYSLLCHSLSRSSPSFSLFLTLLFSVYHCLSLSLSFIHLTLNASSALHIPYGGDTDRQSRYWSRTSQPRLRLGRRTCRS